MGDNGKICFSPTQAIALPPEAWYLVSQNIGKAELRVTLCVLFNHFEVGAEANPLSFSDIVEQTKMSKSSTLEGLNAAIERGSVFRRIIHNQPRYEPRFGKTEPMTCINHDSYSNTHDNTLKDNDHDMGSEKPNRERILQTLVRFGLAYHVSVNIAMTNRYPLEDLESQILYIFHEIRKGTAPHSHAFFGWVVNRIKFNRFAPKDYDPLLAMVQKLMAETGKTQAEIFKAYYWQEYSDELNGLDNHEDYLQWFDNALQTGELAHDTQ